MHWENARGSVGCFDHPAEIVQDAAGLVGFADKLVESV
jgi:hypothetical protein